MKVSSVSVFDPDLVPKRGKGKAKGGDDLVTSPGKVKSPDRAPRPDKRNHLTEEAHNRKDDGLKKTVLRKHGSIEVLQAHLARITSAASNVAQDPMEQTTDEKFRNESISDLDQWLTEMETGRQDTIDEFGDVNRSKIFPYEADLAMTPKEEIFSEMERGRQDSINEFGEGYEQNPYSNK